MDRNVADEPVVSRDSVHAVLISLIHPRPISVTTNLHLREVEFQAETIVEASLPTFNHSLGVVMCHKDITWPVLMSRLAVSNSSALIVRHVDRLAPSVQLHLGYASMQPDEVLRNFISTSAFIFTTKKPAEELHPFLRRQILSKLDVHLDEDPPLVEVPPASSSNATNLEKALNQIRTAIPQIAIVPELSRYIQDIVIFVRTHRLASVGLRPQASSDFELLVRTLCVSQGRTFATPTVIKEAARLSLPVHVRLCSPEDEPSSQYGGDINTVRQWIKAWDGNVLVDYVLEQVPVPK